MTHNTASVGGVIVRTNNSEPEILLIRDINYDDWFLPKGHTEAGESEEQTARREIKEEVGLTKLELVQKLGQFTRYADEADEMKTEIYFLFKAIADEKIQIEPGQNWEARWFNKEDLPTFFIPGHEAIVRDNWEVIERVR